MSSCRIRIKVGTRSSAKDGAGAGSDEGLEAVRK